MSPSKGSHSSQLSSHMIWKEKHKRAACLIAVIGSAAVAAAHATQFIEKQWIHTSVLTGQKWLDELLAGGWQWFFPILLQFDSPTSDQDTQHASIDNFSILLGGVSAHLPFCLMPFAEI